MDIMSFIPSQRQAILERFQQVEALGLGAVRIELKVANPVGIIYECFILAGETRFEHATYGFGDHYSTVEPYPFDKSYFIIVHNNMSTSFFLQ